MDLALSDLCMNLALADPCTNHSTILTSNHLEAFQLYKSNTQEYSTLKTTRSRYAKEMNFKYHVFSVIITELLCVEITHKIVIFDI